MFYFPYNEKIECWPVFIQDPISLLGASEIKFFNLFIAL